MKVQVERTLKRIVKMRYEDGVLKVVANWFVSTKKMRKMIEENAEWIRQHKQVAATKSVVTKGENTVSKQEKKSAVIKPKQDAQMALSKDIFMGRKTLVMGRLVNVVSGANSKSYLEGNVLYINEKSYENRESRLAAIRSYLKRIAQQNVSVEIADIGSKIALCPVRVEFRDVGTFWLKCSFASQRILCFDFRIVQLPKAMRSYLIAHAFAHFSCPIHDNQFWKIISNVCPNYKDIIRQLDAYSYLLSI